MQAAVFFFSILKLIFFQNSRLDLRFYVNWVVLQKSLMKQLAVIFLDIQNHFFPQY